LSLLLNPDLKLKYKLSIAYQKAEKMDMFKRLHVKKAFKSIFKSLWYSYIPCYDVKNISSSLNELSLLKYCEWKGIRVACSAIFTQFPTDKGLCCSFNMKAADDIYRESIFLDTLKEKQNSDNITAFSSSETYMPNHNPQVSVGVKKGLTVLLDAHSDWMFPGSYEEDYRALTAVIQTSGSFPLMKQEGLTLRPGHNNVITLTSSMVNADVGLRSLNTEDRNCLFPEEISNLTFHKKYSYDNCKFECIFDYAKNEVFKKHGIKCQPWFFPGFDDSSTICDPWISNDFFQIMSNEISDSLCLQCLPDCSTIFYEASTVAIPFTQCDVSSLGVSQFCQFKTSQPLLNNALLQVAKEFKDPNYHYMYNPPSYIPYTKDYARSYGYNIFKKSPQLYSTFSRDITMVQIIYQKSTLVQIQSQLTMNWIDYFSLVGGLFGLVLGMGFYSFFEIIWLSFRIAFKYFNYTNWIE
jgi:hypothetical protein